MRSFGLSLGIISLLSLEFQSLSPALAQTNTCTVTASTPSALLPISVTSFGSMSKAVESVGSQYFQVSCPGSTPRSGSMTLSMLSSTKYNGIAKFRVSSTDGIFTSSNSQYSENPVTITIPTTSGDAPSGKVYYQVSITAPDGQVLRAATDYAVNIQAELNLN